MEGGEVCELTISAQTQTLRGHTSAFQSSPISGDYFVVTVADTGCGIPAEKMERPSTLRALRQRVEALGAEFQVDSGAGKGTRLELSIPLERKRGTK